MKILQLCLRFPFPARDGGTMAMASLSEGLKKCGQELHIGAFNTTKHLVSEEQISKAKASFTIEVFNLDNSIGLTNTALNLLSKKAFHVSRFYTDDINEQLKQLLCKNEFDAVVFESIFMSPYLETVRQNTNAVCVLRSHNIEYRIWERVCQETNSIVKRQYLKVQVERLKNYELELTAKFDLIGAITPIDLAFYKSIGLQSKAFVLPFGVDVKGNEDTPNRSEKLVIGFLGSMDWIPNQEGVRWFVEEIWPKIDKAKVVCKIAGKHMPQDLINKSDGDLIIEGEIKSATNFFQSLQLAIVPLRSGSGVRIKVLESMALGVPVLATTIGFEGIEAVANESIFKANKAEDFANKVNELANNRSQLGYVAANAASLIKNKYGKISAAQVLINAIENFKKA